MINLGPCVPPGLRQGIARELRKQVAILEREIAVLSGSDAGAMTTGERGDEQGRHRQGT
jgi:hypothetical protein